MGQVNNDGQIMTMSGLQNFERRSITGEGYNGVDTISNRSYEGNFIELQVDNVGRIITMGESNNYHRRSITLDPNDYDGHSITGGSYNGEFISVGQSKEYDGRSLTLSESQNYDTVGDAENYDGRSITNSYDGHSITMSEYERSTKPDGEGKVWMSRRRSMTAEDNISNSSFQLQGDNGSNTSALTIDNNTSGLIMTRRRRSTNSYDGHSITLSEYERSLKTECNGKVSRRVESENNSNNSSLRNSCNSLQLKSSNTSGLIMTRRRRPTLRGSTISIELSDKREEKKVKGTCCVLL